jgi:anti-sigma regulatory factor (Ser/Thr protein kinase)
VSLLKKEWRLELPPTIEAIEKFCVEFRLWREKTCAGLDAFSGELLLREALTNSVVHGCSEDSSKRVWCVIRAKVGRVVIAIWDEGEGFDWRAAWNRESDLSDDHGRGLEIFRCYASSVRFNPKGNAVVLIKKF